MKTKKIFLLALALPFMISTYSFAEEDNEKEESFYSENIKVKFYGNVKSYSLKYPSVWIIKDKKILVNKDTELDEEHGKISNNSYVEVKGFYDNKNLVATKIEVKKNNSQLKKEGK